MGGTQWYLSHNLTFLLFSRLKDEASELRPRKNTETDTQTVSDLEDAKKKIEAVSTEKEIKLKLQNFPKAEEDYEKQSEALLEKSREEVESQKIIITELEKKNEAILKQLKFQGKMF